MLRRSLGIVCCALTITGASAATLTVNSTADTVASDAFCTLREAILAVNASADGNGCIHSGGAYGTADQIVFNIGSGTPTIQPTSALPTLAKPLAINGNT